MRKLWHGGKMRKHRKNEGLEIWVENWKKDERTEIMKRKLRECERFKRKIERYKIIENWEKGEKIENLSGKLRIGVDLEECKVIKNLRRYLESKERKLKIWVENWEKAEAARERRYTDAHPRRTYVWSPGLFSPVSS